MFVFQRRTRQCEDTRDIPARSRTGPGCHRNKKKRVARERESVAAVTDEDTGQPGLGVENINPRRTVRVRTVKVRTSQHPGHCQVLHSVPSNNNNNNNNNRDKQQQQVLNKYHFFGDSIKLSDDEGIGSAESLTSDQQDEN